VYICTNGHKSASKRTIIVCIHPNAPKIKQKLNQESHKIETQKVFRKFYKNWNDFALANDFLVMLVNLNSHKFTKCEKKIISLTQKHEPNKLKTLTLPWNSLLNLIFVTSCFFFGQQDALLTQLLLETRYIDEAWKTWRLRWWSLWAADIDHYKMSTLCQLELQGKILPAAT